MKTKLITSLRIAANALESGSFPYDWGKTNRCNCGVVACVLLSKSPSELEDAMDSLSHPKDIRTWTKISGYHCPITGAPTVEIFKALHDAGMGANEMRELEYLSNPKVLKRCEFGRFTETTGMLWWKRESTHPEEPNHEEKEHVIQYLRAWADLLTEQGRDDVATQQHAKPVTAQP